MCHIGSACCPAFSSIFVVSELYEVRHSVSVLYFHIQFNMQSSQHSVLTPCSTAFSSALIVSELHSVQHAIWHSVQQCSIQLIIQFSIQVTMQFHIQFREFQAVYWVVQQQIVIQSHIQYRLTFYLITCDSSQNQDCCRSWCPLSCMAGGTDSWFWYNVSPPNTSGPVAQSPGKIYLQKIPSDHSRVGDPLFQIYTDHSRSSRRRSHSVPRPRNGWTTAGNGPRRKVLREEKFKISLCNY